jgi:Smg protein
MKETMLDVLMYLFDQYLDEDADVESDEETLKWQLAQAGFPESEIAKALSWIEGLVPNQGAAPIQVSHTQPPMRVYAPQEMERMDALCRGYLLFLEQIGVLDPSTRELIIDQVMALETDTVDLAQLKWVVLMVLFNQPDGQTVCSWIEDFIFDREAGYFH